MNSAREFDLDQVLESIQRTGASRTPRTATTPRPTAPPSVEEEQIVRFRQQNGVYGSVRTEHACDSSCVPHFVNMPGTDLYLCKRSGKWHHCNTAAAHHPASLVTKDGDLVCAVSGAVIASQQILRVSRAEPAYQAADAAGVNAGDYLHDEAVVAEEAEANEPFHVWDTSNVAEATEMVRSAVGQLSPNSEQALAQLAADANTDVGTLNKMLEFAAQVDGIAPPAPPPPPAPPKPVPTAKKRRAPAENASVLEIVAVANRVLDKMFDYKLRDTVWNESWARAFSEAYKAESHYVKSCVRQGLYPVLSRCLLIRNHELCKKRKVPPVDVPFELRRKWVVSIARAWKVLSLAPNVVNAETRLNRTHFVLGMIYWLQHSCRVDGLPVIEQDRVLLHLFPPPHDMYRYGCKEGDMTSGRNIVRDSIQSFLDKRVSAYDLAAAMQGRENWNVALFAEDHASGLAKKRHAQAQPSQQKSENHCEL